jgi:aminoglycoside 2''-phosphotransferase
MPKKMIETPSIAKITEVLADLFKDKSLEAMQIVDVGFRSVVAETNTNEILLIGRHPGARQSFEKEYNFLNSIAPQLPVQIPRPNWIKMEHENFPFGMMMYRKIPGVCMTNNSITEANIHFLSNQLAYFLQSLHEIDITPFGTHNQDEYCTQVRRLKPIVCPLLQQYLSEVEFETIANWFEQAEHDTKMREFTPTLVHGDLWYGNILVNEKQDKITGIVDFENLKVADPAQDIAPLNYMGADFLEAIIRKYNPREPIDDFMHRVERYWEFREFGGIQYSLENEDKDELLDSIEKLKNGPILNLKTHNDAMRADANKPRQ